MVVLKSVRGKDGKEVRRGVEDGKKVIEAVTEEELPSCTSARSTSSFADW